MYRGSRTPGGSRQGLSSGGLVIFAATPFTMLRYFHLSEIEAVAAELLAFAPAATVIALHGGLGAGKTTLVGRLCRLAGVRTPVSSPTYALVNEYPLPGGGSIHHIDLYRLRDEQEAFDAGLEELLLSGGRCFVEWPERAPGLLPPGTLHVWLEALPDGRRRLEARIPADNG